MNPTADYSNTARVLVVEDEAATQELLSYFLKYRYEAVVVSNFDAAVAEAEAQPFEAVIIDIGLSGEHTGEDVMKTLRSMENTSGAAMIACTAYAMPGDREHFLNRGFDSYISKPFSRERLHSVIDEEVETSGS